MIVSDYIAQFLSEKGVKDVFLLDGSAIASVIVSIARHGSFNYYCPQHEQGGAFAIDGYFKASGKPSVMIATSGPGGQNLLNGVAAAYYDSTPAIFITGNINSRFMKPTDEIRQHGFQENDIVSMTKPVAKYATMLRRPEHIRYELEKAFHLATTGRPGPVLLDIPMDIQKADVTVENLLGFDEATPAAYSTDLLRQKISGMLSMLSEAKRPALLIGGGVWLAGANDEVHKLIETLGIPFFVTWNMIDFCESDYKYYGGRVGTFGGDGRNFGIQNCDLLITLGSRISGRITGGMIDAFARCAKKVIVDIDAKELLWQQVKGDMNIVSDALVFAEETLRMTSEKPLEKDFAAWCDQVVSWRDSYRVYRSEYALQEGSVNPYFFVKLLSEEMSAKDVLVHEAGGNCVITSQGFEAKRGQRVFSNNGNSSLGYALPAAIGAAIAVKSQVVCITGDGGLNFNIQEFQTIRHYGLPVKVIIFNNYAYGITKAYRDTNFKSEYAGVDAEHGQSSPDFRQVATAYGIPYIMIETHEGLREKIRELLDAAGPFVCDVNMKGFYDYQPKLGWKNPIEDQYPFLPRDEFRKNMIIEPLAGWENPEYP